MYFRNFVKKLCKTTEFDFLYFTSYLKKCVIYMYSLLYCSYNPQKIILESNWMFYERHRIFKCQHMLISILYAISIQKHQKSQWKIFVTRIISIIWSNGVCCPKIAFWKAKTKNVSNERLYLYFSTEIEKSLEYSFNDFNSVFTTALDEHAPLKKKTIYQS